MKVVARLPPSGLGSAALPVALPVALVGRWAVGGGLWERGMVSVSQSVRPSVEKSKLSQSRLHPTSRLQRLRRLRQLRQLQSQAPPRSRHSLPAAPAAAAPAQYACAPVPASPPPHNARPAVGRGAEEPAVPRTPAGPSPDPHQTLTGPRPHPRGRHPRDAGGCGTALSCAHTPNSAAAPLNRGKWSCTRGGKSGSGGAGQNKKEWAGAGPDGSWAGRRASFHFPGSSRDPERAPRHLSPRSQCFGGNGAQGWGKERRDPQASVPGLATGGPSRARGCNRTGPGGGAGEARGQCGHGAGPRGRGGQRAGARSGPFPLRQGCVCCQLRPELVFCQRVKRLRLQCGKSLAQNFRGRQKHPAIKIIVSAILKKKNQNSKIRRTKHQRFR